jgi:hypothetical protein
VIGRGAFSCCDALRVIQIPSSVEEIGERAFEHCITLDDVRIGCRFPGAEASRLRVIGRRAFRECFQLSVIEIPTSVEEIGEMAFADCRKLQEVRIGVRSKLRLIEEDAFRHCRYVESVDVPSTTEICGDYTVLANVRDADGQNRKRVKFREKPEDASRLSEEYGRYLDEMRC